MKINKVIFFTTRWRFKQICILTVWNEKKRKRKVTLRCKKVSKINAYIRKYAHCFLTLLLVYSLIFFNLFLFLITAFIATINSLQPKCKYCANQWRQKSCSGAVASTKPLYDEWYGFIFLLFLIFSSTKRTEEGFTLLICNKKIYLLYSFGCLTANAISDAATVIPFSKLFLPYILRYTSTDV